MEATEIIRTRWSDERVDNLNQSVDGVQGALERLQQAMIIAVVAICTMMLAGFGALITLFAAHL